MVLKNEQVLVQSRTRLLHGDSHVQHGRQHAVVGIGA
jgi:hypothetical protein